MPQIFDNASNNRNELTLVITSTQALMHISTLHGLEIATFKIKTKLNRSPKVTDNSRQQGLIK